jgi:hypothetical protein
MVKENVLDQIEWPEVPGLSDHREWERNVEAVKMLCRLGSVTEWVNGTKNVDTYTHMPNRYSIQGVEVEFLPHWGYYEVGGIRLNVPNYETTILTAVQTIKDLERLGYRPKIEHPKVMNRV